MKFIGYWEFSYFGFFCSSSFCRSSAFRPDCAALAAPGRGAEKVKARSKVHREHLENSLQLIRQTGVGKDAAIIDVGGGSSTLADDLLANDFADVSVLDISGKAIEKSKERLGGNAGKIEWIEADITKVSLPENRYDVWHDRAVFHFINA